MENLLVLAALGGVLIAIVNLIRPHRRFGLVSRRRAAALLGVSFVAILIGIAVAPAPPAESELHAVATTTSLEATATGPSGDPDPVGVELVTVLYIIDGDTLTVTLSDGRIDTVRLIGIDTPEFGECFADEATAVLTALAPPGSQIGMTGDVSDRDQFDRLLRYLWVGQVSVNEELVSRGAAVARQYPPDTAMANRFENAQSVAISAGLGLWAPEACGSR